MRLPLGRRLPLGLKPQTHRSAEGPKTLPASWLCAAGPQDVPPSLLATVASVLRNQSHVQQGDHHKNKVCSARIGQLHPVLALSCILQDHDYNVVGLLLSCLELRQVLTTAMGATPLQGMPMRGVLCDMTRNK